MKTAVLKFDTAPDDEIEVRLDVPIGDYLDILELREAVQDGTPADVRALLSRFGDAALVAWTFPEPATGAGMLRRDGSLALAVVREWLDEVGNVPRPLRLGRSDGTPPAPEPSLLSSDTPD